MTASTALFTLIDQNFAEDSIECYRFSDDVSFSRAIYREDFRAILIDASCLSAPCAALARRACYADRRAPLIVVGAFNDRISIERAFAAGADDVVVAPFKDSELAVRTYQALRRFGNAPVDQESDRVEFGAYKLERRAAVVALNGQLIRLTSREFAIAWMLFSQAGDYISRRQIAAAVWSSTEDIVGRTLEQHIYKLRKKLQLNGTFGVHLRTMYAHGYRVELADAVPETSPPSVSMANQGERIAMPEPSRASYGAYATYGAYAPYGEEALVHATHSEAALSAQPWPPLPACRSGEPSYSTRFAGTFIPAAGTRLSLPWVSAHGPMQGRAENDADAEPAQANARRPACSRR